MIVVYIIGGCVEVGVIVVDASRYDSLLEESSVLVTSLVSVAISELLLNMGKVVWGSIELETSED